MALTKQDLHAIQGIVKEEVSFEITPLRQELKELRQDVSALREQIQFLTIDAFSETKTRGRLLCFETLGHFF